MTEARQDDDCVVVEVTSGSYEFSLTDSPTENAEDLAAIN